MARNINSRPVLPLTFSLRVLLMTVLALAILFAWLGNVATRIRHQRQIVEHIEANGGAIRYDYEREGRKTPPGPAFLRQLFGDDVFARVESITYDGSDDRLRDVDLALLPELQGLKDVTIIRRRVPVAGLAHLGQIPLLRHLAFHSVPLTGDGMVNLSQARELQGLSLYGEEVCDATLRHVSCLTSLVELELRCTAVTSDGLAPLAEANGIRRLVITQNRRIDNRAMEYVASLKELESLCLSGTGITDIGLQRISHLPRLQALNVADCDITDDGLPYIMELHQLRVLDLSFTNVGDSGTLWIKELNGLEELSLGDTMISNDGLDSVAMLKNLRWLNIAGTKMTADGLEPLKSLTKLEQLEIGPGISVKDARSLKERVPNCLVRVHGVPGSVSPVEIQ